MPTVSVILTTYNKPQDLVRSLEGFRNQTLQDFEVLVCDDGSGPETKQVIESFAAGVPFPVHHCWQEDAGFRAARSRNNGARRAVGETLVFVDGDCVPLPDFLEAHHGAQDGSQFQAGERYMLEPEEADAVTVAAIASGDAFAQVPKRELKRVKATRRKDVFYRLSRLKDRPRLMTSNCSLPRALFERVNGLDERYEGWGQEDEDLRRRLVRRGVAASSVIGDANCLHLWHKMDKTFLGTRRKSPNWRYYNRGFQLSRCRNGLRERPLSEVSSCVVGPEGLAAEATRALGLGSAPAKGEPLEVEVLLAAEDGSAPHPSGQAEVTVLITPAAPAPHRTGGADVVLAPGVEVQGGELPAEVHADLDPLLARAGVKALRPIPAGPLGAETFAAARAVLEQLL